MRITQSRCVGWAGTLWAQTLVALFLAFCPVLASAEEAKKPESGAIIQAGSADAQKPAEETKLDSGDNAWMLTSSALVLMMTGPGLALFYCGLVRKKNVLSVIMQCVFLMGLMTVIWGLWGYSLSFGGGGKWLGDGSYLCMKGVEPAVVHGEIKTPMCTPDIGNIPRLTHMLFQNMFIVITPALICGAFAERMKFSAMVVFMILWATIVYCPLAHWV